MVRVAINGFGRIGRQAFKAVRTYYPDELEVVAVNDLMSKDAFPHLLKYDSNYGRYDADIFLDGDVLRVDDHKIRVFAERDWSQLPWGDLGVQLVIEASGVGTDGARAKAHLDAGARKVLISAPAKNEDITLVLGVNDDKYSPEVHSIVSNASCTTNALAPVAKLILERYGIVKGLVTTVHSYTNDQVILDGPHKDMRRARSAAMNIIPTTTGAARALGLVIPELKGKFDGLSLRVPTSTVSVIDFVAELEREATVQDINDAFRDVAASPGNRILDYTEEPLVSTDFKGNIHSTIVDGLSTMVINGNMAKVVSWYDNEWGYSVRVADVAAMMAQRGL